MTSDDKSFNTITIKDVAHVAGVSHATVSRVINNSAKVSEEKRQRILDAMDSLGYVPNLQARGLAGGRTKVIGVLIPDFGTRYAGIVIQGIHAELAARDYDMMLYTTSHRKTKESSYVKSLTQGLAEGLLLLLPIDPGAYVEGLRRINYPYVVIDHQGFDNFSPTVVATNRQGAYEGTRYLIELGHQRIGFVAGMDHTSSSFERFAGYQDALRDHNLDYDKDLIASGEFNRPDGYKAGLKLIDLPEPPTAIFAANDESAFGVIDAARERGLQVPNDISVMGFDDLPDAEWAKPALTTVKQPLYEMGRQATAMLFQCMERPNGPTQRLQLSTELAIRATCARFKNHKS